MASASTENLTTSNYTTTFATRAISSGSRQVRYVFSGTYTGGAGQLYGSVSGTTGTYVPIAAMREDTRQAFNGTIGATNFAVIANCGGYGYTRFVASAVGSGTLDVTMLDAASIDVALATNPTSLGSVATAITSSSANAFSAGQAGTTNPAFNVDSSASSAATGWNVVAAAAAAGASLAVISSGTNENGTINAKGSGTLTLQSSATGAIVLGTATGVTGAMTVTSSSVSALTVGLNGATNPALKVNANTASSATGLHVTSAAAAGGLALAVISSGTNENLTLDAKGSGTVTINATGTGAITLGRATTVTTGDLTLTSGNLAMTSGNATLTSGNMTLTAGNLLLSAGTATVTSTSASALTVGPSGATNPVLKVNANTASAATGLHVTGAAAAGGLALAVISSGTNENLTVDAKGSGTVTIGGTSTGSVKLGGGGGTVVLPGTLTAGGLLTCALQVATSGPLIYSGSGAPTISAAVKGSLYLRSDGSSTSTRVYIATDTAGTWTACTTAA